MLSRVFTAARNIIPFKRSDSQASTDDFTAPSSKSTMVTTRGQSNNKAALGDDAPEVPERQDVTAGLKSPVSGRKRRRPREADETKTEDIPTPVSVSKRQKKLPVRTKDEDEGEQHTHFYVEIPVTSAGGPVGQNVGEVEGDKDWTEDGEKGEKVVPAAETSETTPDNLISQSTPTTAKSKNASGSAKKTPKSEAKKIEPRFKQSPKINTPSVPTPKPKHKRFGSEEPIEIPSDKEDQVAINDTEAESSDDDAPEVVTTNAAQEKAQASARDASKAASQQEAKLRQKRKERDAKLKDQAKSSGKKTTLQSQSSPKNVNEDEIDDDDDDDDEESETLQATSIASQAIGKPKLSRGKLPTFLPEEYLSDSEEATPIVKESITKFNKNAQNKKIKFLDIVEKSPRDIVRGSTTFRVAQKASIGLLAPRLDKQSKATKDAWLQGRNGRNGRTTGAGVRKKVGGPSSGFFVNKPEAKRRR